MLTFLQVMVAAFGFAQVQAGTTTVGNNTKKMRNKTHVRTVVCPLTPPLVGGSAGCREKTGQNTVELVAVVALLQNETQAI